MHESRQDGGSALLTAGEKSLSAARRGFVLFMGEAAPRCRSCRGRREPGLTWDLILLRHIRRDVFRLLER
jgi:hypothetical protein